MGVNVTAAEKVEDQLLQGCVRKLARESRVFHPQKILTPESTRLTLQRDTMKRRVYDWVTLLSVENLTTK
jgi:hypothetical protein